MYGKQGLTFLDRPVRYSGGNFAYTENSTSQNHGITWSVIAGVHVSHFDGLNAVGELVWPARQKPLLVSTTPQAQHRMHISNNGGSSTL